MGDWGVMRVMLKDVNSILTAQSLDVTASFRIESTPF